MILFQMVYWMRLSSDKSFSQNIGTLIKNTKIGILQYQKGRKILVISHYIIESY